MAEEAVLSLHAAAEVVEAEEASCHQEVGEVAASYHQVAVAGEEASCRHAYHVPAEEAAEKYRFR